MYTHSHSIEDLTRTQAKIMGSVNKKRVRARKSISRESGPGKDKNGQRYRWVPERCTYMRTFVVWEENTLEC